MFNHIAYPSLLTIIYRPIAMNPKDTSRLNHIQENREQVEEEQLEQNARPYFKQAVVTAFHRLSDDKLTQVAGSLTFTTVLAVVPLLAVVLSLFTAFPIFKELQVELENFLTNNLMPEAMSENIMTHLNSFAAKARNMTAVGAVFLMITSIMLMKTIDEVLNNIWRVQKQRPLMIRVLIYWAILSIGPFMLAASIWASTFVARAQLDAGVDLSLLQNIFATVFPTLLSFIGFTILYYIVPNRRVYLRDAMIGAAIAAVLFEVMKNGFAFYITKFPSYTVIYGTFATIPLFLLWIYLSWLVILFGAIIASIAPQIRFGHIETSDKAGADFVQAIRILRILAENSNNNPPGKSTQYLLKNMHGNSTHTLYVLEQLSSLGYIVSTQGNRSERWVLANTVDQSLSALADLFLLNPEIAQSMADDKIRLVMSKLILKEDVQLKEVLS
ncbi:MAG: YihY family inner membrane protein [Pelistega sp.]|nr:YihY family inner membrane protein [Pelistega sp.]